MSNTLTPPVSKRDHLRGSSAAPMTLVQYGDFECPYVNGRRYDDEMDLASMLEALEFTNPQRTSAALSYMRRLSDLMG